MHIALTTITHFRNRGVEALATTIVQQLHHRVPELEVYIFSQQPDYDASRFAHASARFLIDPFGPCACNRGVRWRARLGPWLPLVAPEWRTARTVIESASAVVSSGGDCYGSDYGSFEGWLDPLRRALDADVPVIFLAQSIGPFRTDREAKAWMSVARHATAVTVRESLSYDYVVRHLGLPARIVEHTADPAFLLEPPPSGDRQKTWAGYGLDDDRPTIALAVSQGIIGFSGVSPNKHLRAWQCVIDALLDRIDARILLVPHVPDIEPANDDRILATALVRSRSTGGRVQMVSPNHSASEIKGLIAGCDLVIAERMHAAIAGLSSAVCTVVVGYSVKARGITLDLLGPRLVERGLFIPVHEFVQPELTVSRVLTAWELRHQVRRHLADGLPIVRARAARNFDLVAHALSGRS
jgi:colanic acid/amylovoran biosynthesis protein